MSFKEQRDKKAFLIFASGDVFHGYSVGAPLDTQGEVIFNTSMIGYQEILSDQKNAGKLIVMTAPEIGCYGVCREDMGSKTFFAAGLIAREISEPSNWRSEESLREALIRYKVPAIAGVDTRALTIFLRENGCQKAFLCVSGNLSTAEAIEKLS